MNASLRKRLGDVWLGADAHQRIRALQSSIASFLMLASAAALNFLAAAGIAPVAPVRWWTALTLLTFGGFYIVIRSGLNLRFADPSLTLPQMSAAFIVSVAAYAITGAGRGAVIPMLMVILRVASSSVKGCSSMAPRTRSASAACSLRNRPASRDDLSIAMVRSCGFWDILLRRLTPGRPPVTILQRVFGVSDSNLGRRDGMSNGHRPGAAHSLRKHHSFVYGTLPICTPRFAVTITLSEWL